MEAVAERKETSIHDGKYLTFVLNNEVYGIEILKVREIIGLMKITSVPRTPDYLKGVINLRGKVIPVIDLRLKFSMPEQAHTQETCVIVVEVGENVRLPLQIGVIVDSVSEVTNIKEGEIEDTPGFGHGIDTNFITALGKVKGKIIILLDIEKVLTPDDMNMVEQAAE